MKTAKLFANGRSQAVRLPAEFRFDGDEVFIRRDAETGDIVLSKKPQNWEAFLKLLKTTDIPDGFLSEEERKQGFASRDPFEGWPE